MKAVPRDFELVAGLTLESANRPLRHRSLKVLEYRPTSPRPGEQLALPGTITVLVARKGNRLMAEIRDAVAAGDGRDAQLAPRLYGLYRKKKPVGLADAVAIARRQPVVADLRYGGKELVPNIFIPRGQEIALIALPYNGGRLAQGGFTLAEHLKTANEESLDVLVLRHTPPLTQAERTALEKVPAEQREVHVGRGPGHVACSVALFTATLAIEAGFIAITWAITGKVDLEHVSHIDPSDIRKMGPNATARELTERRRRILEGKKRPKRRKKRLG